MYPILGRGTNIKHKESWGESWGQVIDLFQKRSSTCPSDLERKKQHRCSRTHTAKTGHKNLIHGYSLIYNLPVHGHKAMMIGLKFLYI